RSRFSKNTGKYCEVTYPSAVAGVDSDKASAIKGVQIIHIVLFIIYDLGARSRNSFRRIPGNRSRLGSVPAAILLCLICRSLFSQAARSSHHGDEVSGADS